MKIFAVCTPTRTEIKDAAAGLVKLGPVEEREVDERLLMLPEARGVVDARLVDTEMVDAERALPVVAEASVPDVEPLLRSERLDVERVVVTVVEALVVDVEPQFVVKVVVIYVRQRMPGSGWRAGGGAPGRCPTCWAVDGTGSKHKRLSKDGRPMLKE